MDKFLTRTKWGKVDAINTAKNSLQKVSRSLSLQQKPSENGSQKTKRVSSRILNKSIDKKDSSFLAQNGYNIRINENKNFINHLVTDGNVDPSRASTYYNKQFSLREKSFDEKKLEYLDQSCLLSGPRERRSQLMETKRHQEDLAKWKERKSEVNRKYRIHKNAFKSGILGLDTPLNEQTLLYKEESENLKTRREKTLVKERKRREFLTNVSLTSSMIEAMNKNFDKKHTLPLLKIVERNSRKAVVAPFTEKWKDSEERLFNQPLKRYSVERAEFLREKETRGRNWNFIGFVDNSVDIKRQPTC